MKNKNILLAAALVLLSGMAAFAFQQKSVQPKAESITSFLVWYQVDEDGQPIDDTYGLPGSNPFNCQGGSALCSRALTYVSDNPTASEVTDNNDGTYSIKSGVDISSSAYYDGTHMQP